MDDFIDPKKIVYIQFGKVDSSENNTEILAWLADIINRMNDSYILSDDATSGDPTQMQELEYLDSTVTGDDHPAAFDMIMSSYNKFKVQ